MADNRRLIDANALMKNKTNLWDEALGYSDCVLVEDIENAPTVDAVEVVHGRWELYPSSMHRRCSVCKMEYDKPKFNVRANYCPNCGAKMDGDGNG